MENYPSSETPEKDATRPSDKTVPAGRPPRHAPHDKPVDFPVSETGVSQADGEP